MEVTIWKNVIIGISIIYVNSEICTRSLVYKYIHIRPKGFVTSVLVYIWSSELQLEYKFCDTQCSILMISLNSMNCLKLTKPRKLTLFLVSLFSRSLIFGHRLRDRQQFIVLSNLLVQLFWSRYGMYRLDCWQKYVLKL